MRDTIMGFTDMKKSDEFRHVMEISNSDKVIILTDHYQINGQIYDCESCSKGEFVNLTNASLCLINDVYENQACDKYTSTRYDWLHVSFDKIVAFSFV